MMNDEKVEPIAPYLAEVGTGYRFDPDQILEQAKGQGLTNVLIIAEKSDGTTWVSSASSGGVALVLMERAKRLIVFGEAS